jgi:hypothetical protein
MRSMLCRDRLCFNARMSKSVDARSGLALLNTGEEQGRASGVGIPTRGSVDALTPAAVRETSADPRASGAGISLPSRRAPDRSVAVCGRNTPHPISPVREMPALHKNKKSPCTGPGSGYDEG